MKNIRFYANCSGSDKILVDRVITYMHQLWKNDKFCNRRFIPAHHKHYIRF